MTRIEAIILLVLMLEIQHVTLHGHLLEHMILKF